MKDERGKTKVESRKTAAEPLKEEGGKIRKWIVGRRERGGSYRGAGTRGELPRGKADVRSTTVQPPTTVQKKERPRGNALDA